MNIYYSLADLGTLGLTVCRFGYSRSFARVVITGQMSLEWVLQNKQFHGIGTVGLTA